MKKITESQKRYIRLAKLINACLDKFSEEEMIEVFIQETGTEYVESKDTEKLIWELELQNYTVIKAGSLAEQYKIEAFMEQLQDNPYQLKLIA